VLDLEVVGEAARGFGDDLDAALDRESAMPVHVRGA
jgi:hypothetical protein